MCVLLFAKNFCKLFLHVCLYFRDLKVSNLLMTDKGTVKIGMLFVFQLVFCLLPIPKFETVAE